MHVQATIGGVLAACLVGVCASAPTAESHTHAFEGARATRGAGEDCAEWRERFDEEYERRRIRFR